MWDSRKIDALLEGLDCEDLGFGGGPSDDFLGSGMLFDGEAKQDSRVVWRRTPLPPICESICHGVYGFDLLWCVV